MTRERWFCRYCGALTRRDPDADGRHTCRAHSDVIPEHLQVPDDPAAVQLLETVTEAEAVYSDTRGGA